LLCGSPPPAGTLACKIEELHPVLSLAAERSLPAGKELGEAEPVHGPGVGADMGHRGVEVDQPGADDARLERRRAAGGVNQKVRGREQFWHPVGEAEHPHARVGAVALQDPPPCIGAAPGETDHHRLRQRAAGDLRGVSSEYLEVDHREQSTVAGTKLVEAARKERTDYRAFGDLINELVEVRPGIYDLMTDDVTVCRCEEVTAGDVRAMLEDWTANVNVVKAVTRTGMGPCQGRICGGLVAELTARGTGRRPDEVDFFHPRPPLKPIPLEVLGRAEPETAAAS